MGFESFSFILDYLCLELFYITAVFKISLRITDFISCCFVFYVYAKDKIFEALSILLRHPAVENRNYYFTRFAIKNNVIHVGPKITQKLW